MRVREEDKVEGAWSRSCGPIQCREWERGCSGGSTGAFQEGAAIESHFRLRVTGWRDANTIRGSPGEQMPVRRDVFTAWRGRVTAFGCGLLTSGALPYFMA